MARKTTGFCAALFLILTSAYAVQRRLDSISELRDRYRFEDSNVFELLYWFADTVYIGNDNVIWLTFNPNFDYGSHYYGNHEGMLHSPSPQYNYYTVGNIHQETRERLPGYVLNSRTGSNGWNRARIIFSVNSNRVINQIFITEHQGHEYNPDRTYEVSTSLLREFRRSNLNEIQRLAESSRRGNFVNTSYSQGITYSNQNYYTLQAKAMQTGANSDDECMSCCVCCCVCLCVCLIIAVLSLIVYFKMKK